MADTHRLPVLTYHSIDDSGSPVSIASKEFRRHMEALAAGGWRTLSLASALDGLKAGTWPRRSFLLTFDDGYASVLDEAAPVVSGCGFTAMVFVISGRAGSSNRWPGQPAWVPNASLLGWRELRTLAEAGWALGAHSCTHARLTTLAIEDAHREILASRGDIEQHCGVAVDAFAYPYGSRSPVLEALAGQTYRAVFGTRLACVTRRSRRTNLDRLDAYYLRGTSIVERMDSASAAVYFSVRRLARTVRGVVS